MALSTHVNDVVYVQEHLRSLGIKYHCCEWADCNVEVKMVRLGAGSDKAIGFQSHVGELVTLLELALARVFQLRPTPLCLRNGYNWAAQGLDPLVAMQGLLQKHGEIKTFTSFGMKSGGTSFVLCQTEDEISDVLRASAGVAVSDGVVLGPLAKKLREVIDWIVTEKPAGVQKRKQSYILGRARNSEKKTPAPVQEVAAAPPPKPPKTTTPPKPKPLEPLSQLKKTEDWSEAVESEDLIAKPSLGDLDFAALLAVGRKRGLFSKCKRKFEKFKPTLEELPVDVSAYVIEKGMSMENKLALVYLLVHKKAYRVEAGSVLLKA